MEKKKPKKLIFVYNANSGRRNAIIDSMHKIFKPSTYDCNLCDITFGVVSENREWKKFREANPNELDFLHKDEFSKMYASKFKYKFTFPIILIEGERGLEIFVSTDELNQLKTSKELITLIEERID
nr:GTPase [Allomuricauda sp.]